LIKAPARNIKNIISQQDFKSFENHGDILKKKLTGMAVINDENKQNLINNLIDDELNKFSVKSIPILRKE
jgi:hypothetical protein